MRDDELRDFDRLFSRYGMDGGADVEDRSIAKAITTGSECAGSDEPIAADSSSTEGFIRVTVSRGAASGHRSAE
jgi:hypothetical protein